MADTPLHDAMKKGNKTLVEDLLKQKNFINSMNSHGNTPLHLAFLNKQDEIIDLLLDHIKKTSNYVNLKNNQGITHLHIASTRQDKDIVKGFIECNWTPIDTKSPLCPRLTPLDLAIKHKSAEVAQQLAKAMNLIGFADANEKTIMHEENPALPHFHPSLFHLYHLYAVQNQVDSCNRLPPFHLACFHEKPEIVKALIRKGANVNEPMSTNARYCGSYTPLHVAIDSQREEIVQLLLDNGADPDRRTSHYMTALHLALYTDDYRAKDTIVDRLYAVTKNKEADLMDLYGLTYLHIACTRNDVKLVTKLLNQGADVNRKVLKNMRNYSNFTPLHFAVLYRREEMVKLLIKRGAKINFDNVETPLHLACIVGHQSIIELLMKHGADPTVPDPKNSKTVLHMLAEHIIDTDWVHFYNYKNEDDYSDDCRKMSLSDFVEPMVKAGVDVNAKDDKGYTALHWACMNIYEASIFSDELIKWGADINQENDDKQTPLQLVMDDEYKRNGTNYVDLYHSVQRIKALGMEVNPKNEECCKEILSKVHIWEKVHLDWLQINYNKPQAVVMPIKEKERNDEIDRMKKTMLTKSVSLYDFVKMETEKAADYVDNKLMKKVVEEDEGYKHYGDLIDLKYWQASQYTASKKDNVKLKSKKKVGKPAKK